MAGFWSGLSGTLRALEAIAARPAPARRGRASAPLRALQYRLHWSSELLAGVEPPAGARDAHAELADALVDARDATGEFAEALERGGRDAAAALLFEWRGALFRVRLARMRLGAQPEPAPRPEPRAATRYSAAIGQLARVARRGRVRRRRGAVALAAVGGRLALVAGGLLVPTGRNPRPAHGRSHFEVGKWRDAQAFKLDMLRLSPADSTASGGAPGGSSSERSTRWRGLGRCRRGRS